MRYFHDLYAIYQINDQWGVSAGFDIGFEQKEKGSSSYNNWVASTVMVNYKPSSRLSLALRGEYFRDKKGVIIATETPGGFDTFGYSLNADYRILPNLIWRVEIKNLKSDESVFAGRDNERDDRNVSAITCLAFHF